MLSFVVLPEIASHPPNVLTLVGQPLPVIPTVSFKKIICVCVKMKNRISTFSFTITFLVSSFKSVHFPPFYPYPLCLYELSPCPYPLTAYSRAFSKIQVLTSIKQVVLAIAFGKVLYQVLCFSSLQICSYYSPCSKIVSLVQLLDFPVPFFILEYILPCVHHVTS